MAPLSSRRWLFLTLLLAVFAAPAPAVAQEGVCPEICRDEEDCPRGEICFPPDQQCQPPCEILCFRADFVCGDDGVTYSCGELDAHCHGAEVVSDGPCDRDCVCPKVWDPVCGLDGSTYDNACEARCAEVGVAFEGTCDRASCRANDDCPRGEICFPPDQQCRPSCEIACFRADPVCGDDGVTYPCGEIDAHCHGAEVARQGACDDPCVCPHNYSPVCGVDGNTYGNACEAQCAETEIALEGECPPRPECRENADCPDGEICFPPSQQCQPRCVVDCFRADFVCGEDGVTYTCGEFAAFCNGTTVASQGPCDGCRNPGDCPVGQTCGPNQTCGPCICPLVFDPVCGADGNDYTNACFAGCAGTETAFRGSCDSGCRNDDDCPTGDVCTDNQCTGCICPLVIDPVCGTDGKTYQNACLARCAHVPVRHDDECGPTCRNDDDCQLETVCSGGECTPCICPRNFDPVCGVDGDDYGNACEARCAHTEVAHEGECVPSACFEDMDADRVPDASDNCTKVANGPAAGPANQSDADGDRIGDVCDCDFNQDGFCNVDDFGIFLPDFMAGRPGSRAATDMNADGFVNVDDFGLFLPGFMAGTPGPPGLAP